MRGSPGNVTGKTGEATYTWDFENRLVGVLMADGTSVSYAYDDAGNRVSTTVQAPAQPAKTTSYLVDTICPRGTCGGGLSHVVAEVDQATGALAALYVRMGDELVAEMRPDGNGGYTTRWVHHDGIGSVRALSDASGVVVDERTYEAFGTRIAEVGADPMPYGFAGEPRDDVTGLAYHRARWMDSRVGRFVSEDPEPMFSGDPHASSRFVYAEDAPVLFTDPTGRYTSVDISVSMAIVSVMATMAAHVGYAATAVSIVCTAEAAISVVGFDPFRTSPCNFGEFNNYEDESTHQAVEASGVIQPPSGLAWFTPTRYLTGSSAKAMLALPRTPVGYYMVPQKDIPTLVFRGVVQPRFGEPGGGLEWTAFAPVSIANATWIDILP